MRPIDVHLVAESLGGEVAPMVRYEWMYDESDPKVIALRRQDLGDTLLHVERLTGKIKAQRVDVLGFGISLPSGPVPAWDGPSLDAALAAVRGDSEAPMWLSERIEAWAERCGFDRTQNPIMLADRLRESGWERASAQGPSSLYLRDAEPGEDI